MITVDLILEDFGENLVTDLRKSLKGKGVTYQGGQESKLSGKIRFEVKQRGDGIVFQLIMPDYAEFVDKGRRAGAVSKEGQERIAEWGRRKNYIESLRKRDLENRQERQAKNKTNRKKKTLKKMPFDRAKKAFAYLVSRKIAKSGYEGNNFFTDVINDGRLETLLTDLREFGNKNLQFEIN